MSDFSVILYSICGTVEGKHYIIFHNYYMWFTSSDSQNYQSAESNQTICVILLFSAAPCNNFFQIATKIKIAM